MEMRRKKQRRRIKIYKIIKTQSKQKKNELVRLSGSYPF